MDRLETYHNKGTHLFSVWNLYSSMDRLETDIKGVANLNDETFIFQYG